MNPTDTSTTFKLTAGSQTRRVTFQFRPTWLLLADRIHTLFKIDLENVAVSYVDVEGDEVTLSTPEELEEYYRDMDGMGLWKPGQAVKFTVLDLSNARRERQVEPSNDSSDEEWQHFPASPAVGGNDNDSHADLDATASTGASTLTSGSSTPTPLDKDKGKTRAVQIEEVPDEESTVASTPAQVDEPEEVVIETSPTVDAESKAADEDPPLPDLDPSSLENARANSNPALTSDIANLISSLSNIVASHPELSEGVRNIIVNATRGHYWPAQRDALYRAAGNLTDSLRHADQEAGRRVADALQSFLSTFAQFTMSSGQNQSQGTSNDQTQNSETTNDNANDDDNNNTSTTDNTNPFEDHPPRPWHRFRGRGGHHHHHRGHHGSRHGPGSVHFQSWRSPFGDDFMRVPGEFPHPPPPPPPPHPSDSHPPPPPPSHFPPPPPPPPPASSQAWTQMFGPHGFGGASFHMDNGRAWLEGLSRASVRRRPSVEILTRETENANNNTTIVTPDDGITITTIPDDQVNASNRNISTGTQPEDVEMTDNITYPTIHRSNTAPTRFGRAGGFTSRHWAGDEGNLRSRRSTASQEPKERSIKRISKKLADMGFSARAHPELPTKIRDAISSESSSSPTPEKEDEITTALVNELLNKPQTGSSSSLSGNAESGSGSGGLPGAWN
ncbi:hypothetical protein V5O48_007619 [Marasmius crinis-equi]|uniref:PB1 domain-containing protein n=1 Tax=Marasmius crinis-equi TaxID=585013 RepID=A0ABR3FG49_9AGAR